MPYVVLHIYNTPVYFFFMCNAVILVRSILNTQKSLPYSCLSIFEVKLELRNIASRVSARSYNFVYSRIVHTKKKKLKRLWGHRRRTLQVATISLHVLL